MTRKRVFIVTWQVRDGIRLVYRFRPLIPDVAELQPLEHLMLQNATRAIRAKAMDHLGGLSIEDHVIRPTLLALVKQELEQVFRGDAIEVLDEPTVESRIRKGVYAQRERRVACLN